MLPLPTGADEATVIGLDPGTVYLGVAELTFNPHTFEIVRLHAQTFDGARLPGSKWTEQMHGSRFRRILAHRGNLVRIFNATNPVLVATESPFYNRLRPNAYGALMEVIAAIEQAIALHSQWRYLYRIDPPTVKRAIGAAGNAKKEGVLEALLKRQDLIAALDCPVASLDEHSIDAIAVAVCIFTHLKNYTLPESG